MATILAFEFAVFVAVLFCLFMALLGIDRRMKKMDQTEVLAALAALDTKIKALIAKTPPVPDLQPIGDAVAAISAEVDAANPPA